MVWNILVSFILLAMPLSAGAQPVPFKDKSVRVIVGFPPGGGSDAEGRVIARHLGKYIAGNPSLVVQNMPGAGGMIASNYFEDLAKPDGLTLYYCVGSTATFGIEGGKYDMRGWEALGSVDRASSVVLIRPDKLDRLTSRDKQPLGIAARTGDDSWSTIFLWGAEYLNWNVRWILGYRGGGEMRVAFERGEADLYATANLLTLRELISAGFRPLTQQGKLTAKGTFIRRPEFPDVPTFDELMGSRKPGGEPWIAYVTWAGSDAAGRPLFAPRKTPQTIVQTLRASFDKLESDKQFMSDLRNVGGEDAEMMTAVKIQPLVKQLLVISPGARDFTKKITAKYLQR